MSDKISEKRQLSSKDKKHISRELDAVERESRNSLTLGYIIKKFVLIVLMFIFAYIFIGSAMSKESELALIALLINTILFFCYLETLKNEIIEKIKRIF